MSEVRPSKIKIGKNNKISVAFEIQKQDTDVWNKYSCSCHEAPVEAFDKAMKKLLWDALTIMEMEESYGNSMKVIGVSFNYKEGIMGAILTCQKDLTTCDSPAIINTPHLPEVPYNDEGAGLRMSPEMIQHLNEAGDQAIAYAKGMRKQMEMDLEKAEESTPKEIMDNYVDEAKATIFTLGRATASVLTKKMNIDSVLAMKILLEMENRGLLTVANEDGYREILFDMEVPV